MPQHRRRHVVGRLTEQGWRLARVNGSHHHYQYEDPERGTVNSERGTVTVPLKDPIPEGTYRRICEQAGLEP